MILVDGYIRKYMNSGSIQISPFNPKRLGSNSYDLTLGNKLLIYEDQILDCKKDNPTQEIIIPEEGYILQPGELYLGYTNEFTKCSKDLVPAIEGKSSVARLGISVHLTAGFGDCSFSGYWTLEITAVLPVLIYPNIPIAQIYWTMTVGNCETPYSLKRDAKYHNQPAMPVSSKMWQNFIEEGSKKPQKLST